MTAAGTQSADKEIRPSKNFPEFLASLQSGLNFTKRQPVTWSMEDWELAVDAGAPDPDGALDVLSMLEDCTIDEVFSGHCFWILFAIAYLRGRAAFHANLSRDMPPFRTGQLQDINIPESMSTLISAQFRLGFDGASKDAQSGNSIVPEWVQRAVARPLARSRAERISRLQ